jgi:hypothetical protein
MSEHKNVCKFTISMEADLLEWVEQKVLEINARDRRCKSSRSAVIAHAVQAMKDSETAVESGKALTPDHAGAKIRRASESFGSSLSIVTKKSSRRAG